MKNFQTLNIKSQRALINAYLLAAIDYSEKTVQGVDSHGNICDLPIICETDRDKVNFIMSTFEEEYIHLNNRKEPRIKVFADWLSGLPSAFNIDYENYRILEIAHEWESLPAKPIAAQEDKILSNWFNFIANKFFQLHEKLNRKS